MLLLHENTLHNIHASLCHPGITRLNHYVRAKNLPYSVDDVRKVVQDALLRSCVIEYTTPVSCAALTGVRNALGKITAQVRERRREKDRRCPKNVDELQPKKLKNHSLDSMFLFLHSDDDDCASLLCCLRTTRNNK